MSNTTEALAALHAAEAELEAALAAEKGVEPESGIAADEPVSAPVAVAEAEAPVAGTPFSRGEDVPPSDEDFVKPARDTTPPAGTVAPEVPGSAPVVPKPKWLVLPGYLGPIAINGT